MVKKAENGQNRQRSGGQLQVLDPSWGIQPFKIHRFRKIRLLFMFFLARKKYLLGPTEHNFDSKKIDVFFKLLVCGTKTPIVII